MNDFVLNLSVNGQQQTLSQLEQLLQKLNQVTNQGEREKKVRERINQINTERGALARKERQDAFNLLSNNEKLLRLEEKRKDTQEKLARASNNEYRTATLKLSLARTEAQMRRYAPPVIGESGSTAAAAAGGALAGGLGGLVRKFAGRLFGLGTLYTGANYIRGQLGEADTLSDLADQYGMTRGQLGAIRRGGAVVGVRENVTLKGLSILDQVRGSAANNDANAMALLEKFGIGDKQLSKTSNPLELAMMIQKNLGAGPTESQKPDLQKLFGQRWRQTLATVGYVSGMPTGAMSGIEENYAKLDAYNSQLETLGFHIRNLGRIATVGGLNTGYLRMGMDLASGRQVDFKADEILADIKTEIQGLRTDINQQQPPP